MPKADKDIEKLIKDNPKLAEYIEKIRRESGEKKKSSKENDTPKQKRTKNKSENTKKEGVSLKDFSIWKEVKKHPLYKISNRDKKARAMIDEYREENKPKLKSKNFITPGQLVLFKYLNPKTKEELEYYDASPCTIFFGVFNSSQGKRVLGFNVHYFPPLLRYKIMDEIFRMYKPVYKKYFETGLPKDLDAFDYKYLTDELDRQNLSFAVRMYIPQLIGDTYIVPPKMWPTALMTEGWFKKETRAAIMNYFKKDAKSKGKLTTGAHDKGKKWKEKHKKK
jgi:hypothetical protein